MLALLRARVTARNVPVGPGKDDYVRTLEVSAPPAQPPAAEAGARSPSSGGGDARVPVVLLPGYGAGACFFWRCAAAAAGAWGGVEACRRRWSLSWTSAGRVLAHPLPTPRPPPPPPPPLPSLPHSRPPPNPCRPSSNIDALAPHMRLFAVDWLGTGRSGRPPFLARGTAEAEAFFVDSLAAWREAEGLGGGKMVLVGHSLGGRG